MTQKKAPQKAPKKKYYKTKNDVIAELKSELEAAEFLHREQIAQMQIEHQKELDAAREQDDEILNMNDDLFAEKDELMEELNAIKRRRFHMCSSVADLADYLSANDLAELLFLFKKIISNIEYLFVLVTHIVNFFLMLDLHLCNLLTVQELKGL